MSKLKLFLASLFLSGAGILCADTIYYPGAYSETIVNDPALATSKTVDSNINRNGARRVSVQVVASTANPAAVAFVDGTVSTINITIASSTALSSATASNTLTVSSRTALEDEYFTLNGKTFYEGEDWGMMTTDSATAISIALAVQKSSITYGCRASTTAAAVVTFVPITITLSSNGIVNGTRDAWGTLPNRYTLTSSTPSALTAGSPTFTGGRDRATLVLNNTSLVNGFNWYSTEFPTYTAQSLTDAINNNATLAKQVIATRGDTIVFATSTAVNAGYAVFTSSQGALAISSVSLLGDLGTAVGYMQNGVASDISTTTQKITKANSFTVGMPVLYSTATGTGVTGLSNQTTYYVTNPSAISFQLASSMINAVKGTTVSFGAFTIDIATGTGSYTLTPLSHIGITSVTWRASNDGLSWGYVPDSSVGVTSATPAGTSTLIDLGDFNYQWLRLYIDTPTYNQGSTNIRVTVNGKE